MPPTWRQHPRRRFLSVIQRLEVPQPILPDTFQKHSDGTTTSWTFFGPGWAGKNEDRIYEIRYLDKDGNQHHAYCKTSGWSGVYFNLAAERRSATVEPICTRQPRAWYLRPPTVAVTRSDGRRNPTKQRDRLLVNPKNVKVWRENLENLPSFIRVLLGWRHNQANSSLFWRKSPHTGFHFTMTRVGGHLAGFAVWIRPRKDIGRGQESARRPFTPPGFLAAPLVTSADGSGLFGQSGPRGLQTRCCAT